MVSDRLAEGYGDTWSLGPLLASLNGLTSALMWERESEAKWKGKASPVRVLVGDRNLTIS
jgi:hypothetical protein